MGFLRTRELPDTRLRTRSRLQKMCSGADEMMPHPAMSGMSADRGTFLPRRYIMLSITRLIVGYVSTNCYIVSEADTGKCVIVDPGDNADGIIRKMEELKVSPEAILLTHGHFDHIMAVPELTEKYEDLPVYAYKEEEVLLSDARLNESKGFKRPTVISDVHYLENNEVLDLLGTKWRVIGTPGHTVGSCCYYMENEGILFSGDTLFDGDCGRTDLATGSTEAIISSIRNVLMQLPDETQVLPGHEGMTTIGRERKYNTVMRMAH